MSQFLYPLTPSEAVFAPFHDPLPASQLKVTAAPNHGTRFRIEPFWCYTYVKWDDCTPGEEAGSIVLETDIDPAEWTRLIFCFGTQREISTCVELRTNGTWQRSDEWIEGTGSRVEVHREMPRAHLSGVRLRFRTSQRGPGDVTLSWFGLGQPELTARIDRARMQFDLDWPGLIAEQIDMNATQFRCGLYFDAADLPALRVKRTLPGWSEYYAWLHAWATKLMDRVPEDDCGDYLPWPVAQFLRPNELGKATYFAEPLVLGLVGLIEADEAMCRHALRYLMCIVHTRHWTQSAESRMTGSTWDQRCFLEESATMTVSILLDWFDWALTDRAKELCIQAIWDKGLAIIERDMMKFSYLLRCNQGPWFCRGRIVGGLVLESAWPRVGGYVERALADMREGLGLYFQPDGGTDEGMVYFGATIQACLGGLLAYARMRKVDTRSLLPDHVAAHSERFVSIMSAVRPGKALPEGDCTNDRLACDATLILASLFPGGAYAKLAASCLQTDASKAYISTYIDCGVFAFLFGPDKLERSQTVVPEFAQLPYIGHVTSFRTWSQDGSARSVRVHVTGAKARPSHSHLDKGAFMMEVDGELLLVDRGTIRYDDARCSLLERTCMHNALTPRREDGTFPDQLPPDAAVLASGSGDTVSLSAAIDLSGVWSDHMHACMRELNSPEPHLLEITDRGDLREEGVVVFHLHARRPWLVRATGADLDDGALAVNAPWAESISASEDLIDLHYRPVYHLQIISKALRHFDLVTTISIA